MFHFPVTDYKFKAMLYAAAGVGKTVATTTLLKIPGLKVRYLCIENNSLPAIEQGLKIHGINDLEEGQCVISTVTGSNSVSAEQFMEQTDSEYYTSIITKLVQYKGTDVATGKQISLGNTLGWKNDTILVIDGLTMLEYACSIRGRSKAKAENNKDPRAAFYAGQDALKAAVFKVAEQGTGNFLLLAHSTQSDEEARKKHKGLTEIHPALGTRSVVSTHLGRFSNVFYARINIQQKDPFRYVWSVGDPDVYTIARNIDTKGKPYKGREVNLNNLPADFSYEGYNFFPHLTNNLNNT